MKPWALLVGCMVLAEALSGCGGSATTDVPANAQKVHVVASNFKWTMDQTSFKAGVPIDFIVSSTQSTHGFNIVNQGKEQVVSQGNSPVNVVWTPSDAGDYTIACDQWCGSGHANMFLTFHVTK